VSNDFYPELSESGKQAAQDLVDHFKIALKKAAEEVIDHLYTDVAVHIESDSWTNYRNKLMDGFRNYGNRLVTHEHDFKAIRAEIYKEFRDDIIKDLDQDNLKQIEELEKQVEFYREINSIRSNY
jgi:hypothetical protein